MVTKEQKGRMTEFMAERLEDSRLYHLLQRDDSHILVAERPDLKETPATIDVVAINDPRLTVENLRRIQAQNSSQRVYTSHLFYKDGKSFMVRLGRRGNIKGNDRSLKRYDQNQLNAMVHLRGLEKDVLADSPQELAYYQPRTERLPESIRIFEMGPVRLDYYHLKRDNSGYKFARDGVSKDYRLPREIETVTIEPVQLITRNSPSRRALVRKYN